MRHPDAFIQLVDSHTREFVASMIEQNNKAQNATATSIAQKLAEIERRLDALEATLNNRMSAIEARYREDEKFAITRARIAQWIKEADIR